LNPQDFVGLEAAQEALAWQHETFNINSSGQHFISFLRHREDSTAIERIFKNKI
jgi:hypothetical protein